MCIKPDTSTLRIIDAAGDSLEVSLWYSDVVNLEAQDDAGLTIITLDLPAVRALHAKLGEFITALEPKNAGQ